RPPACVCCARCSASPVPGRRNLRSRRLVTLQERRCRTMEVPLEIRFHNMTSTPHIEADVRNRVDKLDRLYDRLIACLVAIEPRPAASPGYGVHIEMTVPGTELVVSRDRHAHPELRASLRDAFHAAERQLKAFKARSTGAVLPHETVVVGEVA